MSGFVTFTGNIKRSTRRKITGVLSFIGSLTPRVVFVKALSGIVSFVGSIKKSASRKVSGSVTFNGKIQRLTHRTFLRNVTFNGMIRRSIKHGLSGTLIFSGSIAKRTARRLFSAVSFIGTVKGNKPLKVIFTATVSFVSSIAHRFHAGRFVQYTVGLPKTAWTAATTTAAWTVGASKVTWSATSSAASWIAGRIKPSNWSNNDVQ
jgi:hypothetical protein